MGTSYKVSNVNWSKVLENYRGNYNYNNEWEIVLSELLANSLDAKATQIRLSFNRRDKKIDVICEDNGKGMDEKDFEEYHNLGSLSKDKQSKTIGFAGIGAKLCLDLCDKIYTETSNGKKRLASVWFFDHSESVPKYRLVEPENKLSFKKGTFVKIEGLKFQNFDLEQAKSLILDNYRYSLKPLGEIELEINNETLISEYKKKFEKIKSKEPLDFSYPSKMGILTLTGEIIIAEIPRKQKEKSKGIEIDIVVCGKTITTESFDLEFNIQAGYEVLGYIRCDELIQIVKTSKDGLNKNTKLWNEFKNFVSKFLEKYLKKERVWREFHQLKYLKTIFLEELGEEINKVLYQFPEFSEILNPAKRRVLLPDSTGSLIAKDSEKGQLTTGTIGGPNPGSEETIPTEGMNANIRGLERGEEKKAIEKSKRVSGIKIISEEIPDSKERVIFRAHESLFILNESHPAYKLSEDCGAIDLYSIFVIFDSIIEYSESMGILKEEGAEEYLWRFYEELLKRWG